MLNFATKTAFHVSDQLNDWTAFVKDKTEITLTNEDRAIFATHLLWTEQFLDKMHPSKDGYKNLEKFTALRRLEASFKIISPFSALRAHQSILNTLKSKIELLAVHVEKTANLHFFNKNCEDKLKLDAEKKIFLQPNSKINLKTIETQEKHIFHLMLSKTEGLDQSSLDLNKLEASNAIHAFTHYEYILQLYLEYKQNPRVAKALQDIQQANSMALSSVLYNDKQNKADFFNYCDALYKNYPLLEKSASLLEASNNLTGLTQEEIAQLNHFLSQFILDSHTTAVPKEVVLRWIKNKLFNKIHALKPGESCCFQSGTNTHAVLIEIELTHQSKYVYTIFNTGAGVSLYHTEKLYDQSSSLPFQIKNLNKDVFSDAFLEELILCPYHQKSIQDFYELHYIHLIEKGNGYVGINQGKPYPLQLYGTCAYDCVDAWLNSRLKSKEMREINLIKATVCINRQITICKALKTAPSPNKKQIQHSETLLNLLLLESHKVQSQLTLAQLNIKSKINYKKLK